MESKVTSYAVLLPITSLGSLSPFDCLQNLKVFAKSLGWSTRSDVHSLRYEVRVYLAIDEDDFFLLGGGNNRAIPVFKGEGITNVVTLICNFPRGRICDLWRACARRAWEDGCDYYVLMGDDVVLHDEGWMRNADAEFLAIAARESVCPGFGVVAFRDISFPGFPTFPVIHRTHMTIFCGEVVPECFINQDGDPFLYQLYRRWGCSTMMRSRIENRVGGPNLARYAKEHTAGWTFQPLDDATQRVQTWLREQALPAERKITLDVIIPCYRVNLRILERILNLRSSSSCTPMFIIIIDDPASPHTRELETRYEHRSDVRIRKNSKNIGASASRNRGLRESAAEWVHFLDDDVVPEPDLLVEAERVIRAHPKAAGFIGHSRFPMADTVFTTAIHLAGVTHFWDIARKMEDDVPWGVTANLIARRSSDGVEFDLRFPKTGGGEDIDFCLRKRLLSLQTGGEGFWAAPLVSVTHPWWNEGARSYLRFYRWAKGDGGLIKLYSNLAYWDAPNSSELLLIAGAVTATGSLTGASSSTWLALLGLAMGLSIVLANVLHDLYRHSLRYPHTITYYSYSKLRGLGYVAAVVEGSLIRLVSEGGRMMGILGRGEIGCLGRRFDWFAGRAGTIPIREERRNSVERLLLMMMFLLLAVSLSK